MDKTNLRYLYGKKVFFLGVFDDNYFYWLALRKIGKMLIMVLLNY